jgi:hypothetical protein
MLKRKKIKTPPEIPLAEFQWTERAARRAQLMLRARLNRFVGEDQTHIVVAPSRGKPTAEDAKDAENNKQ